MYPGYNVIINTILAFVRLRNSICSQFKAGLLLVREAAHPVATLYASQFVASINGCMTAYSPASHVTTELAL